MQVTPMFFLHQASGVNYPLAAQVPQYRMQTLGDLQNIPILGTGNETPQILADVATISRSHEMQTRLALQHPARDRHLRRPARPRPRRGRRRGGKVRRQGP